MQTTTQLDKDRQNAFLSAVRESQAAVIDALRVWSETGQRLTRDLRLPVARIDLADAIDRTFDVAEQTLAAQRELARTLTGVVTRQANATVDTTAKAADTTVETVEGTVRQRARQVEGALQDSRRHIEQAQASTGSTPSAKAASSNQDRRPGRRTYEDRSIEELRERARELDIEGRSAMNKDQLIAALRQQAK